MVLIVSITLIIGPALTTAMIIASALATASTSGMAVAITLREISYMGYDKILDFPGNYCFDYYYYFGIGLGMGSDFIDLCHENFGL